MPTSRLDARWRVADEAGERDLDVSFAPDTAADVKRGPTAFNVLGALSLCHLLNDMVQSLLPSIYPILKTALDLDFSHIGLITLANQLTASLLQPVVGLLHGSAAAAAVARAGMTFTLAGLLLLAWAGHFGMVLAAAALIGIGSSIFHPESSRIARLASGGQHGLAQSLFQVGGNAGSAVGPLLAAFIVLPRGQGSLTWFAAAPVVAITVLWRVGRWYRRRALAATGPSKARVTPHHHLSAATGHACTRRAAGSRVLEVHSTWRSLGTYYTFYLIETFHVSVRSAQLHLFVFLGAVAAGTILGGPVGDRFGRKYVIWGSILGVLPFTLALPHANLRVDRGFSAR